MSEIVPATSNEMPAHRMRYLLDIVVLIVAVTVLEAGIGTIYPPHDLPSAAVFDIATKLPAILFACWLIRLRGERISDIGVKTPFSWPITIFLGFASAALVFVAVYLSEKAGYHRDLSRFSDVQDNLPQTLYGVAYSFLGAGFYEEFMFRGFLFQGVAMFFGGSGKAWKFTCILQAVLFGAAHAYQNPLGIVITGTIGLLFGVMFLALGRNLWAPIIAHGLYDASRFILFYFQGAPAG